MIELKLDKLVVSFPELQERPRLVINFQRTLRIPDDERNYPLPPGLGSFPLRHIDDYARTAPPHWLKRGGVLLPMWQSEAMWLNFGGDFVPDRRTRYPFAVKIATGKINAITGESWGAGLSRNPQDYLVAPPQPWLDGYCVEKGIIRQFVAMPIGAGFSVEEQLTGKAEFGGLQIEVFPMRWEAFERRFPIIKRFNNLRRPGSFLSKGLCEASVSLCQEMSMAPGGRMRQEIYDDPYSIHDWDTEHGSRCFAHLVNSETWQTITGEAPPSRPLTAEQYTRAGYPWFDYYAADQKALQGSTSLAGVKSVGKMAGEIGQVPLPDNQSVSVSKVINLRAGLARDQVRETEF